MATSQQTADDIVAALDALAPDVRVRKMFGEYGVYYQDVIVGFICDDTMFLKDTEVVRKLLASPVLGKPYPGAKDYLLLGPDIVSDETFFAKLVADTKSILPPKKKR
jgi:DNA transformation protein